MIYISTSKPLFTMDIAPHLKMPPLCAFFLDRAVRCKMISGSLDQIWSDGKDTERDGNWKWQSSGDRFALILGVKWFSVTVLLIFSF